MKTVKELVEETGSEKLCVKGEGNRAEGCCLKELDSREGGGGSKGEGALCVCFSAWHSLAWLGSRPLWGSQVFSPGAANSLWWCSYMFNYALEPACLYLCLIGKTLLASVYVCQCLCAEAGSNEEITLRF